MGRNKIKIEKIPDSQNRKITFDKRRFGVLKKAMELGTLCDCEIFVLVFCENKLYQFASSEISRLLLTYIDTDSYRMVETHNNESVLKKINDENKRIKDKREEKERRKARLESMTTDSSSSDPDRELEIMRINNEYKEFVQQRLLPKVDKVHDSSDPSASTRRTSARLSNRATVEKCLPFSML